MRPKYTSTLDDSESEAEAEAPSPPSEEALENSLRDTVTEIFNSGRLEELTVKRVRLAAETKLGLTAGFFKSTGVWKMRSEEIIKDEVKTQDQLAQKGQPSSPKKSPSPPLKPKPAAAPKRVKPESAPKSRKRQKTESSVVDKDDEMSVASGDESEDIVKPKKRSKAPIEKSPVEKQKKAVSDDSEIPGEDSDAVKPTKSTKEDESESEMSVVLDEEPQPKAQRKRQKSAGGATKTKKASKAKDDDITPDQAEIKRLQGWLVKCGIRKLWGKELAPYDTPKAKIKHLKGMLEDAGMTGRPSQEKANQIREERELKADLEMIQEGAKQWGANSDEDNGGAKPRRRLARARQSLAFLESGGEESERDGEETD